MSRNVENEVDWRKEKGRGEEREGARATDLWILETGVRSRLEVPEITEDPFLELFHVGDRSCESFESEDQSSDCSDGRRIESQPFARPSFPFSNRSAPKGERVEV